MLFKDENGTNYELVREYADSTDNLVVRPVKIRPVKQEPKNQPTYKYLLDFRKVGGDSKLHQYLFLNIDQAQLIKQSVGSLIEYIFSAEETYPNSQSIYSSVFVIKAAEARHSIKGDK